MARFQFSRALIVPIVTALVAIVALAGVGLASAEIIKVYAACSEDKTVDAAECGAAYRPAVWSLVLEALALLGSILCVATGLSEKAHHALIGFLVLAGAGMINMAEKTMLDDSVLLGKTELSGASRLGGKDAKAAGAGFVILVVMNVALILYMGIQRVKGSASAMRPGRTCTPARYSASLFIMFCVAIGCTMVAVSNVEEAKECSDCNKGDISLKWWGASFVLAVMVCVAVCEVFGILENFGTTLAAFVALTAVTAMDITNALISPAGVNDLSGEAQRVKNLQIAGFITLSALALGVVLVLGLLSGGQAKRGMELQTKLIVYSILPLLFGIAMTIVGVSKYSNACKIDCDPKSFYYLYWTVVFEVAAVALGVIAQKLELEKLRVPAIMYIALATVSQMVIVGTLIEKNDSPLGMAAGGLMITTVMNFALLLLLGTEGSARQWGSFARMEV